MRVGVDLVDISRIQAALDHHGQRFLERVFTEAEIACYGGRAASLAARWAAKEAVAKALGSGIGEIGWREIEVLADAEGAPVLHLYAAAAARAATLGLTEWAISLSHTDAQAIAFVAAS